LTVKVIDLLMNQQMYCWWCWCFDVD